MAHVAVAMGTGSWCADVRLVARHPEVYEPSDDSFLLADALADAFGARGEGGGARTTASVCLEVGVGSGFVCATLARLAPGAAVYGTDASAEAVECARETCRAHGVEDRVSLHRGDLVPDALLEELCGAVDVLAFNPPYVPTPPEEVGGAGAMAAWAGGWKGREVIDRFLPLAPRLLTPRTGELFLLVLTPDNDVDDLAERAEALGLACRVALSRQADEERLCVLRIGWR